MSSIKQRQAARCVAIPTRRAIVGGLLSTLAAPAILRHARADGWITGIEADARIGWTSVSSGNLSRAFFDQITASSLDVGKPVCIALGGGSVHKTTVANFVNSSTVDLTTPVPFAVTGAETILATDNASVIQAAVDSQIEVAMPPGWIGASNLNFTGARASVIRGVGGPFSSGTWLHPLDNSGAFLDAYGRGSFIFERIGWGYRFNPNAPKAGLLSGGPVDHIYFDLLMGTGKYQSGGGAFVQVAGGLGKVSRSAFWAFSSGAFGWVVDLPNSRGFTSNITIGGPYALAPWTWSRVEAHAGVSGSRAILIKGLDDTTVDGFIWSGYYNPTTHVGETIAQVEDVSNGTDTWSGMRRVNLLGGRTEAEGGPAGNVFDVQGAHACVACNASPTIMWGCTGDIVAGSYAADFRSNFTGLPRN